MFVIRREQLEVFRQAMVTDFEREMVAHAKEFSPKLSEILGDDAVLVHVRQVFERAAGHGFTNRGPVRLFLELTFLFGSAFDTDPQYPWAARALGLDADQMHRAERLYERTVEYQEKVSGPGAENTWKALGELSTLTQKPLPLSAESFADDLFREMARVFPEKVAFVGREGMLALIGEGRDEARKYRFPPVRGEALMAVLMFAFGHGCTADALYPWIEGTLKDDRILDGAARADRLERKAMTWLGQVLAAGARGEPQ